MELQVKVESQYINKKICNSVKAGRNKPLRNKFLWKEALLLQTTLIAEFNQIQNGRPRQTRIFIMTSPILWLSLTASWKPILVFHKMSSSLIWGHPYPRLNSSLLSLRDKSMYYSEFLRYFSVPPLLLVLILNFIRSSRQFLRHP